MISVYCPPSQDIDPILSTLESQIANQKDIPIIISGDFNSKHPIWSPNHPDPRGLKICDFLGYHGHEYLKRSGKPPPTFSGARGSSWIDLTLLKRHNQLAIINWKVIEANLSDHNFITYEITNIEEGHNLNLKMKLSQVDWLEFRHTIKSKFQNNSHSRLRNIKDIDKQIEDTTVLIQETYDATKKSQVGQIRHHRSNPWWTKELNIQRKKVRALRRRYHRAPDSIRKDFRLKYKIEQAKYEKIISKAKRASWDAFWQSLQITSPLALIMILPRAKD
ncbi:uncharacterized protein LOC118182068 [Stegodyphus dumicola]|uniref:uncharacterized protein LOC118182068 n=1 Tax=Stegodyphus dumicola TaxID=202533 RepID=UPI0015B083E7|nr:uncharacterized protein LOC118182068 [Stegodyphus dumicola]